MNAKIYAIRDTVAESIIGGLQLHKHDAAAVRTFGDIAADPQTQLHRHVADFELVCLGRLNGLDEIEADYTVIITGAQWAAAQKPAE